MSDDPARLPAARTRPDGRRPAGQRAPSELHVEIFTRLNAGEPIPAEPLTRRRLRWFQPGTAMYAIVLIPVMFAAIIVGALLGGGTRSATVCEASYSVGGVSPLTHPALLPGQGHGREEGGPQDDFAARLACGTSGGYVVRFTTLAVGGQTFSPAIRTGAVAAWPTRGC